MVTKWRSTMGLLEQIAFQGNIETEIRPFQVAIKASSRTSRSCRVASAGSGDPGYAMHGQLAFRAPPRALPLPHFDSFAISFDRVGRVRRPGLLLTSVQCHLEEMGV
jgi:hypothetical protein